MTEEHIEQRELWLSEHGRTEDDVMEELDGTEFIKVATDEGFDEYEKVELPEKLQNLNRNLW